MFTKDDILAICQQNEPAARFLWAYQNRCHHTDDMCDEANFGFGDHQRLAAIESDWLLELASNPWFIANRATLVPLMVLASNSWSDSNDMSKSADHRVRRAADVVKGHWHEVLFAAAWIIGGGDHLRAVTAKFRKYDYDCKD